MTVADEDDIMDYTGNPFYDHAATLKEMKKNQDTAARLDGFAKQLADLTHAIEEGQVNKENGGQGKTPLDGKFKFSNSVQRFQFETLAAKASRATMRAVQAERSVESLQDHTVGILAERISTADNVVEGVETILVHERNLDKWIREKRNKGHKTLTNIGKIVVPMVIGAVAIAGIIGITQPQTFNLLVFKLSQQEVQIEVAAVSAVVGAIVIIALLLWRRSKNRGPRM